MSNQDIPKTLQIVTIESENAKDQQGMFPSPSKIVSRLTEIQIDSLKSNLNEVVTQLASIVDNLPTSAGGTRIETITFTLSVNNTGKVALVGELAAGLTSSITITMRRSNE